MKVTAIMEKAKDGHYSCYVEEDLPGFGLSGFGDTAEAAKEDMMYINMICSLFLIISLF